MARVVKPCLWYNSEFNTLIHLQPMLKNLCKTIWSNTLFHYVTSTVLVMLCLKKSCVVWKFNSIVYAKKCWTAMVNASFDRDLVKLSIFIKITVGFIGQRSNTIIHIYTLIVFLTRASPPCCSGRDYVDLYCPSMVTGSSRLARDGQSFRGPPVSH